jgi:hypothetical protein
VQLYARRSVSYPPWQSRVDIPLTQAHLDISCYPSPVVQASIANSNSCTFKVHIAVYTKRPASVWCFPRSRIPTSTSLQPLKRMLSLAPILPSVSISWKSPCTRHSNETPLPSSSEAVCFLVCRSSLHAEYQTTTLRRKNGFIFPSPGRPAHTKLLYQIASGDETIAGAVHGFLDRKSRPSRSGAMGSTHSTGDQSRHSYVLR